MKIDFKIEGLAGVKDMLKGMSDRRIKSALATALTRTAIEAKDAAVARMSVDLDRPTPYTRNSVRVKTATGTEAAAGVRNLPNPNDPFDGRLVESGYLSADVFVKDASGITRKGTPATEYLMPQVVGGARRLKRLELALQAKGAMPKGWQVVPAAGARLDAYGNVSRGQVMQVISQLGTELVAGANRTMSTDARKRINAQRRAGGRFFVVMPGGGKQPGVYQREFYGHNVTPVFIFVRSTAYRPRYGFHAEVQRTAQQRLPANVQAAIAASAARLAARGKS